MLSRITLLLATLAFAAPASAESVWVGGLSGAGQTRVAYLGRVAPLPGQQFGDGWGYGVSVDQVHYEYDSVSGRVDGDSASLKASAFRDIDLAPGTLTLGGGIAYQHVSLSSADPGNRSAGTHVRAVTEAQWRSRPTLALATQAFAQYIHGADSHFASAFVGRRTANGLALGAQMSTAGDPSYRVHGLALALRGWKRGSVEWSFHAGAQHQESLGTEPEIGLSFVTYRP